VGKSATDFVAQFSGQNSKISDTALLTVYSVQASRINRFISVFLAD
jgi:hypothetical protein